MTLPRCWTCGARSPKARDGSANPIGSAMPRVRLSRCSRPEKIQPRRCDRWLPAGQSREWGSPSRLATFKHFSLLFRIRSPIGSLSSSPMRGWKPPTCSATNSRVPMQTADSPTASTSNVACTNCGKTQLTHDSPYVVALYKHQRVDFDDMKSFMLAAEIGQACIDSMPEGIATYRGNKIALLLPRESVSRSRLGTLGKALGTVLDDFQVPADSLHLDVEPVPLTPPEVQRLLGSLWN